MAYPSGKHLLMHAFRSPAKRNACVRACVCIYRCFDEWKVELPNNECYRISYGGIFFPNSLTKYNTKLKWTYCNRTVLNHACISGRKLHARIKGAWISSAEKNPKSTWNIPYVARLRIKSDAPCVIYFIVYVCVCTRGVRKRAILCKLFICSVS